MKLGRISLRARAGFLLVILVTSMVGNIGNPAHVKAATPARGFYGVNTHPMWVNNPQQDAQMNEMQKAGAQSARIDAEWGFIEQSKDVYNQTYLARMDYAINGYLTRGIDPLVIVTSSPTWANGTTSLTQPPINNQDYDNFLGYLMNRWQGKVHAYEIWNEPDGYWSWGTPSAVGYTNLLKSAYTYAKGIDPSVKILAGSLFSSRDARSLNFLTTMYANGAKNYFDILSQHYYGDPPNQGNASTTPEVIANDFVNNILPVMQANGDGAKRVWVTETGSNTASNGLSEAAQADYLTRAYAKAKTLPNVDRLYTYDMVNDGTANNTQNNYGLVTATFNEKPAFDALQALTGASGPTPGTILGDLNNDGLVTAADVSLFIARWARTSGPEDFNVDHHVDVYDLSFLLSRAK